MAEGKFQGNKTDGSLGNPYLIEDVQDLNAIRFYPTKNFKLAKTINLGVYPYNTGKGWMPIDNFSGTLDGDGYKILNLYVNRPAQDNCGLFARIFENTNVTLQVKNVYFENANVHGRNNVGIIAGYLQINEITKLQSEPFFSQCKIVGKVQGSNNLGLVLGHLNWVTELNQPCTFANNMSIKGQVAIDIKGSNYSGVLGLTSNTKQSPAIHHTICNVSFNRHVSNVDTDLNPDFWGATTLTSSDSFYKGSGFGDLTFFKEELIEKNGDYCEMCGQTDVPLQVDHIVPISKGGLNEISNMQLLCYECHMKKHNYYFDELGSSNRKVPKKYELLNWAYRTNSKIEIKYKKYDGIISKRIVRPITGVYYKKYGEKGAYYITAFCYLRNENREFRVSRIEYIKKINKE